MIFVEGATDPRIVRQKTAPTVPEGIDCRYRGTYLRTVICGTCSGQRDVAVFSCELYDECSLYKKIPKARNCAKCGDRKP